MNSVLANQSSSSQLCIHLLLEVHLQVCSGKALVVVALV